MFKSLINHQWKEKVRSPFWQKSLILNILFGIFILYLILNLIVLGFFIDRIMDNLFPGVDPVNKFTQILFYYFLADLLTRFFLQQLPAIEIKPYLTFPIKKRTMVNYLLFRSAFSLFNLLPLIVFIPFVFKVIVPVYSFIYGIFWLLTIVSLILINNFLLFLLKKYLAIKPFLVILIFLFPVSLFFIDYKGILPVSEYFGKAILEIASNPFLFIIPFSVFIFCIIICRKLLSLNSFLEDIKDKSNSKARSSKKLTFLNKYGAIGQMIRIELKMILRNNRPRTLLFISGFFMLYGFVFYQKHIDDSGYAFFIAIGIVLTGIFMMQYGQFVFAWESSFFDLLLTKNITKKQMFNSKMLFFYISNLLSFLLSLPYALFNYKIGLVNLCMFLFNSGINVFIILFFATFNTKRIDLGKGAFLNYEGVSGAHYILIFPIIGIPLLIYLPFALLGYGWLGFAALGFVGIICLIFRKLFLELLIKQFDKRKYKLGVGFRKK